MKIFEVQLDTRLIMVVEAPDAVAAQEHVKSLVPASKHKVQFRIAVTQVFADTDLTQYPGYSDREIARNEAVIDVDSFQRGAVQEGNNLDEPRTLG